ncbi:MAG: hypothetical protein OCU22_07365 [Canidatus Methanoxibalbensis ujae]|nr:hypothetical protein [Candidatus Methanoxibalbensis ujae]
MKGGAPHILFAFSAPVSISEAFHRVLKHVKCVKRVKHVKHVKHVTDETQHILFSGL